MVCQVRDELKSKLTGENRHQRPFSIAVTYFISRSVILAGVGAAGVRRSDVDCDIVAVLAPIESAAVDSEVGFANAILDHCGVSTPGQKNRRGFAAAVGGVDVRVRHVIINEPESVAGCDNPPGVA